MKQIDFAASGQPIGELRVALRRFLIEFQNDLAALETEGLEKVSCDKVKRQLAAAIDAFERIDKRPHTVSAEIAKHLRSYTAMYHKWNGHEGTEPGKPELRKRELFFMIEARRKLCRALAKRQKEFSSHPQLSLPFSHSVQTAIATVALQNPEQFPRLKQALALFKP